MEAGCHITASSKWLVPQDLIAYIRGGGDPPRIKVVKFGAESTTMIEALVDSLPILSGSLRSELLEVMPRYCADVPTDEQLAAAFLDVRSKNHRLVIPLRARARAIVERRIAQVTMYWALKRRYGVIISCRDCTSKRRNFF